MTLLIQEKEIVVPGEAIAEGIDYLPGANAYRHDNKILAKRLGVVSMDGRALKVLPLAGKYVPKIDDKIIVNVYDITLNGWLLNTNSAYNAMLNVKDIPRFVRRGADLTQFFDIGDYLRVKIVNVTSQKLVDVSMKEPGLAKLGEGRIILVNPNKVPRIIGKSGSMVSLIKDETNCSVTVGQNGVVWIRGKPDDELKAVNAIKMIEKYAHISGLTDRVTKFLRDGRESDQ